MASHPGLRDRFLLYWARLYASQSRAGDGYELLNPVISICFLDWRLFPQTDRYHLPFRLQEPETGLVFSEHLAIHVFQLPNFKKELDEPTDSLDKWPCFLNNGESLNPEDLPESIRIPEVEEAMSVLEELLNLPPTPAEQLDAMRPDNLRQLVDQLRHRHRG